MNSYDRDTTDSPFDFPDIQSAVSDLYRLIEANESLVIVCHDNPDPDCLSSALALKEIANTTDIDSIEITYGGEITHQQNRAMINKLNIQLTRFDEVAIDEFDLLALVDHSVPGQNNSISTGTIPDIVIDHHPMNDVNAEYLDLRPYVGATATIFTEYLDTLDIEIGKRLATALLFGIHRETLGFTRGTTLLEHVASGMLHPRANHSQIQTLIDSVFSSETLDGIGKAILNRDARGSCLVSTIGRTKERDILPQAADYLLKLEGISTAIVFGIIDDTVHLSARTRNNQLHIGDLMAKTFDEMGSAGGHSSMAGGQVPLGPFGSFNEDNEVIDDIANRAVRRLLFDALEEWIDD